MGKHAQSIDSSLLSRIYGKSRGWVFTPNHFIDLGSRNAVASALKRHKKSGIIRQLARGLYDYPVQHPIMGTVAPSADAIARALVGRDAIRLQPTGAYAANLLGLSDQVPMKVVFLTDGPTRHVQLGKRTITLKHTTPKNMATAGRKSGTLIQALRHLGQAHVDDNVIRTLRRHITSDDTSSIRNDLRYAPGLGRHNSPSIDQP